MKYLFLIILIFLISNCSKPKVVLICGDHVCINKAEAERYFEDNLSIEVKVIEKKVKKETNLVELNLKNNQSGKREVNIVKKEKSNKQLKTLSNKEIKKIKQNIKDKNKEKKLAKKNVTEKEKKINKIIREKKQPKKINLGEINVNKRTNNVVDICTKLEKCSIDEISKYLLEEGKKKDFPDITIRQ
tara:strand:+ start:420 stop:980 length:561 start_codon:yes stop_codon:yes gene_type:complete